MSQKKIMQLIGCLNQSGAEKVVVELARRLRELKYSVVVCSREGGILERDLDDIPTFIVPKNGLIDSEHLLALCKLLGRQKIDLVHSHLFGSNLYGLLSSLATKRKIVFTVHGEDCLKSRKREIFYRMSAGYVAKIVAVSGPLYGRLTQDLGIREDKVRLIPNGIDILRFRNRSDAATKRIELGLPPDGLLIGTIGTMKPVKGQDVLIRAAAQLKHDRPETRVVIVGGSSKYYKDYDEYLRKTTRENALEDHVYFLGQKDNVEKILPIFDVFVLPSRSEGTSMALLEAMACGKPVVATRVGGTPHLIHDRETGLLVPPEDPTRMAEAIAELIKSPPLARRVAENARKRVEQEFSIESMVESYLKLYDEVFSSSARCTGGVS